MPLEGGKTDATNYLRAEPSCSIHLLKVPTRQLQPWDPFFWVTNSNIQTCCQNVSTTIIERLPMNQLFFLRAGRSCEFFHNLLYTIPHKNHHETEWTCVDSWVLEVVLKKKVPPKGAYQDLLDVCACLFLLHDKQPQTELYNTKK